MRLILVVIVLATILGFIGHGSNGSQSAMVEPPAATQNPEPANNSQPESADGSAEAAESADQNQTFHGYECTDDCSGHEAGYNWASEHGIDDPDDCPVDPNNSHSFTEGCWAEAGRDGP